jgi:hypothetical protein
MSLALLFHYLLLNMFRMLVHPSSGACDLFAQLFRGLYCSGSMCVGVTVWFGWVVWEPYAGWSTACFSLHKDTTPPQPNHTITPTHIKPEQYNTWNKSTVSRKLLKMDVLTFETCWAVNSEIIKQVTSSWSIFIQLWMLSFAWIPILYAGRQVARKLVLMQSPVYQIKPCCYHKSFSKCVVWTRVLI